MSAIRASTSELEDRVIANTGNEDVMAERKRVSSIGGGRTPWGVLARLHIVSCILWTVPRIDPPNGSLSKSNPKPPPALATAAHRHLHLSTNLTAPGSSRGFGEICSCILCFVRSLNSFPVAKERYPPSENSRDPVCVANLLLFCVFSVFRQPGSPQTCKHFLRFQRDSVDHVL